MGLYFDPILNMPRKAGLTLRITNNGDGTLTLTWSGYNLTAIDASGTWTVQYSEDGISYTDFDTGIDDATLTKTYDGDDGLLLGTQYWFRVLAKDSVPATRATSNVATTTTPSIETHANTVAVFDPQTRSSFDTITMADFNGTNQWLECADNSDFTISSGIMSVTFTCNRRKAYVPNGTNQDRAYLGQISHSTANGGGWIVTEGSGVSDNWNVFVWLSTNSSSTSYTIVGTGESGTGRVTPWSQCTVVINLAGADHTTKVKIYLDGTLQSNLYYFDTAALASLTAFQNPTTVFNIGRFQGLGRYFDGCMSRVGFWNGTALSAGNATTLWNGGDTSTYADVVTAGLTTNLKFWLNMDESSGTRADSTANDHDFAQGNGTQNALEVVTEVRDLVTAQAFTNYPGLGPIYSATGLGGRACWYSQNNSLTGYLRASATDFFRDAEPQDVLDATAWGTIISSSEAGVFATTYPVGSPGSGTGYAFTCSAYVDKDSSSTPNITPKTVPALRLRNDTSPNYIFYMNTATLVANAAHTTHWRFTGDGSSLANSYKGWFDNVSQTIKINGTAAGVTYGNSFADTPTAGNTQQGLMSYPTYPNEYQGTEGKLYFGGLVLASGNDDAQATQLREAWEARNT